mmetsp:Transcript_59031/g.104911  ORF Transcript_59031/g.104911 Transcript_59031/m.104911 type:complete len:209 (-) Transcript_59031:2333-2959(-)
MEAMMPSATLLRTSLTPYRMVKLATSLGSPGLGFATLSSMGLEGFTTRGTLWTLPVLGTWCAHEGRCTCEAMLRKDSAACAWPKLPMAKAVMCRFWDSSRSPAALSAAMKPSPSASASKMANRSFCEYTPRRRRISRSWPAYFAGISEYVFISSRMEFTTRMKRSGRVALSCSLKLLKAVMTLEIRCGSASWYPAKVIPKSLGPMFSS